MTEDRFAIRKNTLYSLVWEGCEVVYKSGEEGYPPTAEYSIEAIDNLKPVELRKFSMMLSKYVDLVDPVVVVTEPKKGKK